MESEDKVWDFFYFHLDSSYNNNHKNQMKELNNLLQRGWRPVRECGYSTNVLILLRRPIKKSEVVMTEVDDAAICG